MTDCPFGEKLQRYWARRYDYFQRFDEGIQLDSEGLHTVMPEAAALMLADRLEAEIVLDGFCGVGGISIALARQGKRVIAVELDPHRLAMARHNASIYGVDEQITFIQGDFFEVAPTVTAAAVVLDPPWGWPRLRFDRPFLLEDFTPHGLELINFSLQYFPNLLLRAPRRFEVAEMGQFGRDFHVYEDVMRGEVISKSILMTG